MFTFKRDNANDQQVATGDCPIDNVRLRDSGAMFYCSPF